MPLGKEGLSAKTFDAAMRVSRGGWKGFENNLWDGASKGTHVKSKQVFLVSCAYYICNLHNGKKKKGANPINLMAGCMYTDKMGRAARNKLGDLTSCQKLR